MATTEEQPREAMAAQIEALAIDAFNAGWRAQIAFSRRSPPCLGDMEKEQAKYAETLPAIVTALRQAEAAPGVEEALEGNTPGHWLDPQWEKAGRVHDWRNHVGEGLQALWPEIPSHIQKAIYEDANYRAGREEWD